MSPQMKGRQMTDEQESQEKTRPTGNQTELGEGDDSVTVTEYRSELKYTVPSENLRDEQKAMAGKEVIKEFTFGQVSTDADANAVMKLKGWSVVDFVNDALKSIARSGCYQSTAALYKASKLSAEEILERSIRDMVRAGIPEEIARSAVSAAKDSASA